MADLEHEHDALAALVTSDGWRLFTEYVREAWGPAAYRQRCRSEIAKLRRTADLDDVSALSVAEVEAATQAIEQIMTWPGERLKKLDAKKDAPAKRGLFSTRPRSTHV